MRTTVIIRRKIDWLKKRTTQTNGKGVGWPFPGRCNRVFEWQYRCRGVTRILHILNTYCSGRTGDGVEKVIGWQYAEVYWLNSHLPVSLFFLFCTSLGFCFLRHWDLSTLILEENSKEQEEHTDESTLFWFSFADACLSLLGFSARFLGLMVDILSSRPVCLVRLPSGASLFKM